MSTIRVDNFGPSAGGTTYSARGIAKAWVNFNGTGTVAVRDSENVASITDNATGDYTVNFANAFANSNLSAVSGYNGNGANNYHNYAIPISTSITITNVQWGVAFYDTAVLAVAAHGDLA